MKYFKLLLISLAIITVAACSKKAPEDYAYKIMFMEQEQFVEPYPTRVIVTPEFLRFDDGDGAEDFILFDRKLSLIHSVVVEEQTIMTVHKKDSKAESPIKLKFTENDLGEMKDAPKVGGQYPRHYQLLVNDEVCNDLIAVNGLLPAAVSALKDFSILMASDSKETLSNIPADVLNACDLAQDTFAPTRQLMFGFPVQTMGRREYARTLVDFDENYKVDKKLFVLPVDYKRYTVQELRDGKVKFDK
ncbi:hypothetical protein MNBD_GAMMA23-961 [hydrothermal vent metagenome]|uniref:Lipoprotein n=1 Tax=hydrothermal vent metagenome TaxID=652676 RepID=A0A3B1ABV2_9ZZZZ